MNKEFDVMEEGAKVYKLVGMALVPQALEESKTNVNSRIEYLKQNMYCESYLGAQKRRS